MIVSSKLIRMKICMHILIENNLPMTIADRRDGLLFEFEDKATHRYLQEIFRIVQKK